MRLLTLMMLTSLASASAFSRSTLEQQELAVKGLADDNISSAVVSDYNRQLKYEKDGLNLDQRVETEVNLVASSVRKAVTAAYLAELKETNGDIQAAKNRVMKFAEKDLAFADPQIAEEIKKLTQETLDGLESGGSSNSVDLENVAVLMKSNVADKMEFLENVSNEASPIQPTVNGSKDAEKKEFASMAELIESLVSTRESAKWVSTSNQVINVAQTRRNETKIGVSIKIPFLGITGDLGTTIVFKRDIVTSATINAEGLDPILRDRDNFEYNKKDQNNRNIIRNGKIQKRFMSFTCEAELNFENEITKGGGLSFAPPGLSISGERNWVDIYANKVTVTSRRIALPEYVGNQTVTVKMLTNLCQNYFLKAKYRNNMTVEKSLDISMRNLVAGLEISNSKTKCAIDSQCYDWYNKKVAGIFKVNNWPRCVQEDDFLNCRLKGLKGQNCPVIEKGKRISNGEFEFSCDQGLKCVKTQNIIYSSGRIEKFLLGDVKVYAKGHCMPNDSKAYKDPMTVQKESLAKENHYLEIELQ